MSPPGRLNLQDGQWKTHRSEALANLEKGLKLSPKQPQAHFMMARLNLLPGGGLEKAMHALDNAVAQADDDAMLRAKALLLRGTLRKDAKKRISDLDEANKALPGNAMLLRARGLAHSKAQDWNAALDDFNKAIVVEPNNAVTYQLKAAVLVKLKRFAEALPVLEKAHALWADNSDLLVAKAQIYIAQKDYKSAIEELTRALAANGSNLAALELPPPSTRR